MGNGNVVVSRKRGELVDALSSKKGAWIGLFARVVRLRYV